MGMKLVKKKKINFEKGRFFIDDKIVHIDHNVAWQLNEFETKLQKYIYLHSQPEYSPEPSLDGWERVHNDALQRPAIRVETPLLEAEFEKAKGIMAEVDNMSVAREVDKAFQRYAEMLDWLKSKKILVTKADNAGQVIDTPTLGNPLEVSAERVIEIITGMAADMDVEDIISANGNRLIWEDKQDD